MISASDKTNIESAIDKLFDNDSFIEMVDGAFADIDFDETDYTEAYEEECRDYFNQLLAQGLS